jgi:hypothetical protein
MRNTVFDLSISPTSWCSPPLLIQTGDPPCHGWAAIRIVARGVAWVIPPLLVYCR